MLYRFISFMRGFVKRNTVMVIAFLAAVITSFVVPIDKTYIEYFDFKTLTCLFCVLAVVCALKNISFFYILAEICFSCSFNAITTFTKINGIKVSLIRPGFITLPPHEYGFIGGASGVYEKTVYFFGDVRLHPDFDKIKKAIEEEGFDWISLSDEPLADVGGFIAP